MTHARTHRSSSARTIPGGFSTLVARWLALSCLVPLFVGGCGYIFVSFDFEREVELTPGEVRGVVVRADLDGLAAPFASIVVEGGAIRRAGADGRFSVKGLKAGAWVFRAEDDVDGDGFPERTALVSAVVRQGAPQSALPIGDNVPVLSAVLLGPVLVDGTTRVEGRLVVDEGGARVTPEAAGLIGRIVVTREFDLPTADAALFDLVTLGSEATAAPDDTGKFVLSNVGTGTFQVVAFLFEKGPNNALGALVGASAPLKLRGFAGERLDIFDTPLVIERAAQMGTRPVQIPLSPPPSADVYAIFGPPGLPLPPCDTSPPTTYAPPFAHASRTETIPAPGDAPLTLPFGVHDLALCTLDGVDGPRGELYQVVVSRSATGNDALPIALTPVLLVDGDPCGDPEEPDCDGDGLTGLPPFSAASESLWRACVSWCLPAFGSAQGVRTCRTGGTEYDCDDDGDGQPDVTEHPNCYGLGRGTDLDGDGLCSGTDPFPHCTLNTAQDCLAGENDFEPQVPDAWRNGEGPGVVTLFDERFGDNGQLTDVDPLGPSTARTLAAFDNGDLLVVGSYGPTELTSVRTLRIWRVSPDGVVLTEPFDVPVLNASPTVLDAEPIAAVIGRAEDVVYVLSNAKLPPPLAVTDVAVTKIDLAERAFDAAFGVNGSAIIDVATFGTTEETPTLDHAAGLLLDEEDVLWVVGDTLSDEVGANRNLFFCALGASDGAPSTILSSPDSPGACFIEVSNGDQYAKATMRTEAGRFVTVGAEVDFNASGTAQAFLVEHELQGDFFSRIRSVLLTDSGTSVARAMHIGPTVALAAETFFVVGELDDRLAIWRVDADGTSSVVAHPDIDESVASTVAIDASGNVFAAGRKGPVDGPRSLIVYRYSSTVDQGAAVALLDEGAANVPFTRFAGAASAALVNSEDRLTLAGHVVENDVMGLAMWRFNPIGPTVQGTGSQTGACLLHSDCTEDCGSPTDVALCTSDRVCVCDDPCSETYEPLVVDGVLTLASAAEADAMLRENRACIQGAVVIEDFADPAASGALSRLKRVLGPVTVRNSPNLTTLDLAALEIVDGNFTVELNPELFSTTSILPRLKWITGNSTVRFAHNAALQTFAIGQFLSQLSTTPIRDITGNGCTGLLDTSCEDLNLDETCTSIGSGRFRCEAR
jgi:hypothetical protein